MLLDRVEGSRRFSFCSMFSRSLFIEKVSVFPRLPDLLPRLLAELSLTWIKSWLLSTLGAIKVLGLWNGSLITEILSEWCRILVLGWVIWSVGASKFSLFGFNWLINSFLRSYWSNEWWVDKSSFIMILPLPYLTPELLVCIFTEPTKLFVAKELSTLMKFELLCPIID